MVLELELSVREIRSRLEAIRARMQSAARSAGRDPSQVELVVVTKAHTVERTLAAVQAGADLLGENYVEEGVSKMQAIASMAAESDRPRWHMIGHVQSRKARQVSENFDFLHALDSVKLAGRLDRFAGQVSRVLQVLVQVNVSGEATKFGLPAWEEQHWPALVEHVEQIITFPNLQLRGLMTIPPFLPDAEEIRPYFQRTRVLRDRFKGRFPHLPWDQLSMGMSADFEVAIQEGATLVRVGQAILGPRPEKE